MPRGDKVQLNLSVDDDVRESLRAFCDKYDVSLAQAITNFVRECEAQKELIGTSVSTYVNPNNSTSFSALNSASIRTELSAMVEELITPLRQEIDSLRGNYSARMKLTASLAN